MNLSNNLSLVEVTKSQTAVRHGINNTPNAEQLEKSEKGSRESFSADTCAF